MKDTCYEHREIELPRGHLDPSVDCTYVLIMHGSPREKQIYQELMKAEPTSKVILQYNQGYKKCDKALRKDGPNYDLEHALKHCFKDALSRGYKRVLVLEDDCEFDERIRDPSVIHDLNTFLVDKDPSVYNLGPFVPVVSPMSKITNRKHQLLLYNAGSHANIYNERYMKHAIDHDFMMGHTDMETNRHMSKYMYKVPLAYQKIIPTENSQQGWGNVWPIVEAIIVKPFGIDKDVQPGYDRIKRTMDFIVLTICLLIFFYLIKNKMGK